MRLAKDGNDKELAQQIRELETEQGWWEGAIQAVYSLQCDHLALDSEEPPCCIRADEIDAIISRGPSAENRSYDSARLLKKMLAAGVSKFDPQPIDSLAAVQQKRKRK